MKIKRKRALLIILSLFMALAPIGTMRAQAKTRELYTSMWQKSNEMYKYSKDAGFPVAYKVDLGKSTIVIYGSMSDYTKTGKISKHTYKLAGSVKFVTRGGEAPDQKMTKSKFKKYLKKVNDVGLSLVLEFKNNKVVCVAISS